MLCYLRCGHGQRGIPAPVTSHWIGLEVSTWPECFGKWKNPRASVPYVGSCWVLMFTLFIVWVMTDWCRVWLNFLRRRDISILVTDCCRPGSVRNPPVMYQPADAYTPAVAPGISTKSVAIFPRDLPTSTVRDKSHRFPFAINFRYLHW